MGITVAEGAINDNQCKQLLHVLTQVLGSAKLLQALHDGGFVAAAVFPIGALGVQYAKIFEPTISAITTEIKTIDYQSHAIFGEAVRRQLEATPLGHAQAEKFIGSELRKFICLPKFDNVGSALKTG